MYILIIWCLCCVSPPADDWSLAVRSERKITQLQLRMIENEADGEEKIENTKYIAQRGRALLSDCCESQLALWLSLCSRIWHECMKTALI